jgi:hypothetical protein
MATLSLFAAATDSRVDAENGILHGVRVITKGEAKTHSFLGCPIICDDITIADVVREASTFADGVPVKLAHGTDIEELVGSIRGIYADGDCARGDLYLLKTHESFATLIEMAETMPSNFGVSISFLNLPEPVMNSSMGDDGDGDNDVSGINPDYQDDIVAYAARVVEGGLFSADLVSNPSCNPSLFSIMSENPTPEAPAVEVVEIPSEAPKVEETIAGEIKHIAEVVASELPDPEVIEKTAPVPADESLVSEEQLEVKGPEGTQNLPDDVKPEIISETPAKDAKKEIPAPAELSRKWGAVTTDLEATRTELSAIRSELSAVKSELTAARGEIAIKDASLVELNMLHRSVLSVMGLSASDVVPEIANSESALSVIERYEAMPAGSDRLSFFQANRKEIETALSARVGK